ncbi:unnamed protein product [Ceratitis capitata]|uniref:(Mediterranean fruit fly) hypothetical protein n=1 Tax=Ceratitis capitata TaxID=7213 RepID=A0A811URF2_CERCA|nr:unnamed protein product [Ceratitis capitata]
MKTLSLNLGLRRDLTWNFVIADGTKSIIAADFLSHFDLIVPANGGIADTTAPIILGQSRTSILKFIKNAAEILAPLNKILEGTAVKGSQKINRTEEQKTAFQKAKNCLANVTLLSHPNVEAHWAIFTDGSDYGVAAAIR